MTRRIFGFASATLFALSLSTAWAQEGRPSQDGGPAGPGGGDRGGGTSTGAGAGGGGAAGGGAVSSGGGGGSSVGSSGGFTSSGASSFGEGRVFGAEGRRSSAPMRDPGFSYSGDGGAPQRAVPRGGGDTGGGRPSGGDNGGRSAGGDRERAAPRGEAGERGGSRGGRVAGRADAVPMSADGPSEAPGRNAVPAYSRPREGRTAVGTAIDRGDAVRSGRGGIGYEDPYWYYGGYYSPYGLYSSRYYRYGYPGYGFGLGYFYDPFMFGGFGYDPYSYGGGYYGSGGSGYYRGSRYDTGSLRLKVRPADAKVYVDGYFVGVVDSFDGAFQRLAIEAGAHRIEIRADGYEPAQFEVMITPGETVTYKGELKRTVQ